MSQIHALAKLATSGILGSHGSPRRVPITGLAFQRRRYQRRKEGRHLPEVRQATAAGKQPDAKELRSGETTNVEQKASF